MRDGVLIQEQFDDDELRPWKVVVASVLCKQTTGRQVRPTLEKVLERWPNPTALCWAGDELEKVLRPTGFKNRRAEDLRGISCAFADRIEVGSMAPPPSEWVAALPGCGPYIVEAYRFVVEGDRSFRPADKELRKAWNRDRGFGLGSRG